MLIPTYFIFALFIFDSLENVVDDSCPCGVVEKGVFVVDDETKEDGERIQ